VVSQSPNYKAPSIPKMGKNFSPLMFSNQKINSAIGGSKLKASKMSFTKGLSKSFIKPDSLSKVESSNSINISLTETNSILVEIQKQLELDFASRIAERKENLASAKKKIRKKKLVEKEEFVERSKGISKNIISFGSKVLSPVKSIFDKILDFLAIVGTGIALNSAWKWLSDEENRKKLLGVLEFLGKN